MQPETEYQALYDNLFCDTFALFFAFFWGGLSWKVCVEVTIFTASGSRGEDMRICCTPSATRLQRVLCCRVNRHNREFSRELLTLLAIHPLVYWSPPNFTIRWWPAGLLWGIPSFVAFVHGLMG